MTEKKRNRNYYHPQDARLTDGDRKRGLGIHTPLGLRFCEMWYPVQGLAQLAPGDKAQLRRAGYAPRETIPAVYIRWDGVLYNHHFERCSGADKAVALQISVAEWKKTHGEAA